MAHGHAETIQGGVSAWIPALVSAAIICLLVIVLFYNWFALEDRYVVFLYNHLGATPFDGRTSGRYWMSGLVASGAVMLLNTLANWFLGRLAAVRYKRFSSPASWRVWLLCLIPLAIAIPYITMSLNQPTLPLRNALACFVATVIGLALALSPSSLASQSPKELTWLVFGGIGLVPCLLLSRAIELPAKGLASVQTAFLLAIGSLVAGSIWMVIVAWVRVKSKKPPIRAMSLFMAGLCLSYLLLPLLHYLLLVPPKFRYISASTNFFAFSMIGQIVVFLVAAALAVGSAELQTRWQNDSHRAR